MELFAEWNKKDKKSRGKSKYDTEDPSKWLRDPKYKK